MQELACVREERDTLKEDLGTISRLKQEEVADRQLQVAAEAKGCILFAIFLDSDLDQILASKADP